MPGGLIANAKAASVERVSVASLTSQIVEELHGVSISDAKPVDLAAAVRKVVARSPKQAAAIVAEVLAVERPDMAQVAGLIVSAAIEGLGHDAPASAISAIVRTAVELQRPSILNIVRSGARSVGSCEMVSLVVQSACQPSGEKVMATDGKNVVPVENKEIVPLQRDDKFVKPLDGKSVVEPVSTADDEIAKVALEARPDCIAELPVKTVTPLATPAPLFPNSTPSANVTPQPTPPTPSNFRGVIKSPAYIDPFPVIPSR